MVHLRIIGTQLVLAMTLATLPAEAAEAPAGAAAPSTPAAMPAAQSGSRPGPPLVPEAFQVPLAAQAKGFKLVPFGPDLAKVDYAAYMSSIEHLQTTFSRSTSWPHAGISDADALADMQREQARFNGRKSFAYAVLTPDGSRERGSVYVSPSPVPGYDAVVRMWVTKPDYDAGFDGELYTWVTSWIQAKWPFQKVAYPGRTIPWSTWDASVAASRAAAARPAEQKN